jgi:hypothetical protein
MPPALGPELTQDDAGLDGLAAADLVCEDHALRQRAGERKNRRLDLVRVQPGWRPPRQVLA